MANEPRKIWARGLTSHDIGKLVGIPIQEGHLLLAEDGLEGVITNVEYRDKHTVITLSIILEVNNQQEVSLYD